MSTLLKTWFEPKRALAIARALFVSRKPLARRVVSKKAYAGEKEKT
jgi:hypothetical protein